jgi:SLOG family YspA-like protein
MRVIIAGSRSIKGEEAVQMIDTAMRGLNWNITEVISGDAPGIDTAAVEWAKRNNIDYVRMPANWELHGKRAGYLRNKKMAWYARVTSRILELQGEEVPEKHKGALVAFWKNNSRGTGHMIDLAREFNLETKVFRV